MQYLSNLYPALRPKSAPSFSLAKRRQWFADETPPAETSSPPETPPAQTGDTGTSEQTFTQADVDRLMGERARRAKEAAISDLLKDLGFDKADELKAVIADAKKRKEAEMSEAEKLQAQITALEAEKAAAESKVQEAEQRVLETRRNSAIIAALTGAEKPQSVLTLLEKEHAELVGKALTADGTVDEKAVAALVEAARKDYAGMFKVAGPGTGSHNGGRASTTHTDKILDQLFKGKRTTL
jgi:hypothetical protein